MGRRQPQQDFARCQEVVRAGVDPEQLRVALDLGGRPVCLIRFGGNDAVVRSADGFVDVVASEQRGILALTTFAIGNLVFSFTARDKVRSAISLDGGRNTTNNLLDAKQGYESPKSSDASCCSEHKAS